MSNMRIGQGFDVHAFMTGDHIILGGVTIPYEQGLKAHSDGDVVLHALSDALPGTLALGDIGQHFPDNDPNYKGADSRQLLKHVYQLIAKAGYRLQNADITIIAQVPKMATHIEQIRKNIANDLSAEITAISVKATTEQLGFTGRKERIAAQATVLIDKK